ncbi:MAG: phenylalanine--tRNA ligase beta subunit-related protein [Planctomycetota bacterium]
MVIEKKDISLGMDPSLGGVLRLGGLVQRGVSVSAKRGEALSQAIAATEEEMRQLYIGLTPGEIPGTQPARRLYRSIGEDPTRMRTASEALLRRILKGNPLPEINNVVDTANLVSLRHLIPVGLYDVDRIEGEVRIRLGLQGEHYERIGAGTLNLNSRLGLFDDQGGFGNPTGDSRRTSVREGTRNILFVAFFPADPSSADIIQMMADAKAALTRYAGGTSFPLNGNGLVLG